MGPDLEARRKELLAGLVSGEGFLPGLYIVTIF